jgi:hypothetical protein
MVLFCSDANILALFLHRSPHLALNSLDPWSFSDCHGDGFGMDVGCRGSCIPHDCACKYQEEVSLPGGYQDSAERKLVMAGSW